MIRVLFVCMGNICRSPLAQGVLEHRLRDEGVHDRIWVDSAGTHAYHVGEAPDRRAVDAARRRGIEIAAQRARRVRDTDFAHFDLVVAMDMQNRRELEAICPPFERHKLRSMLDFAPGLREREVPDPYFGGEDGFEKVIDMLELAVEGLLDEIRDSRPRREPSL